MPNLEELIPREVETTDHFIGYSKEKKIELLKQSSTVNNQFIPGDLSETGSELTFEFGVIQTTVKRLNTTEVEVFLSASEDLSINFISRLSGPSSPLTNKKNIDLTSNPASVIVIQVGTYMLAEFWIVRENQCYYITAGANEDYSKSWVNITRYN